MTDGEGTSVAVPGPRGATADGAGRQQPALHWSVLGPVRIRLGEQQVEAGQPRQRALLATLLLREGRTASAQELIGALWGEEPPQQARAALRTYASRLRKALGPRADALVSESGGYALRLAPGDTLDTAQVTELASAAEKAAAGGDPLRAHALYGEALALWESEPLTAVPGPDAEVHRRQWEERRRVLLEQRLEKGLQAGLHAESVSELTTLTNEFPTSERFRELLMLALYRSGRQAEALGVYADARRYLLDELGVDPGPELAELHQRILNADESLIIRAENRTSAGPTPVTPHQLPAAVPDFTGRRAFVAELGEQLASAGGSVMALSAVAGIGGVGKTTLAVQVAHACRDHFPDGQLYTDLQGAGQDPAEPGAVLGAFLRALGVSGSAMPDGVEERAALYRSLLDGRRVLALLDNARDAAQVRPLLPGTPGCAALITSRVRMIDLAGAHLVDLDVMSPEEALAFFTRIVGTERVAAERQAARDVVGACGFLPLAIRIAASRLASRRTWTVATLAERLADERRRLDELTAGDQAVAATFELGYQPLDPEQARAFRLLGLADGPDISLPAAAALLDRGPAVTEDLLESLVDASLLESAAPGRYRFHDLVRLFARARAERDEQPPAEREAARTRLLDFYLATAATVYGMQRPGDRLITHLEPTAHPGLRFTDRGSALDWLYAEGENLLAAARQAAHRPATLRKAADLLLAAQDLAESGVCSHQFEQAAQVVRAVAARAGDARAQGRAVCVLAHGHSLGGRMAEGNAMAREALNLGEAADDPVVRCTAANDLGIIAHYQGRLEDSARHFERALAAFRADENLTGQASVLTNVARIYSDQGLLDQAIDSARHGVEICMSLGLALRLANARYSLGITLTNGGRPEEALTELHLALRGFRDSRQRLWEGVSHFRIAEAHLAAGRPGEAASHAETALVLGGIGGEWRRGTVLVVLGRALDALGQTDRARACWRDALAVFEELGSPEVPVVRELLGLMAPVSVVPAR
ncbi:AfsR/SARP family transcriptional regulator [Streptomyces aidingensis]|uniref:DNA-binding transcriptional activator of the SARP family n=1 Tax=Streptomyces aidingensis TaxID=910347 RepID=A0A1I1H975_9ACTN|nr:BTAD domain-containing putative transcriptional regulator [Streptomyces aidingensis]SFC20265.1 DNA-binding transcriptional activator of the SARP family [Streptomyces aidingensis]